MHFFDVLANPLRVPVGFLAEFTLDRLDFMNTSIVPLQLPLILRLEATLVTDKCHLTFLKVIAQLLLRFRDELTLRTGKPTQMDHLHVTFQRIELGSPFPEGVSNMTPRKLVVRARDCEVLIWDRVKHWGVWTVTAESLCSMMHHMVLVPATKQIMKREIR